MNIFFLDETPDLIAQAHCDKHVVKMCLETAQLLCTAHQIFKKEYSKELYKPTHVNHPMAKWVRATKRNYMFTFNLFQELCEEYDFRYGKIHKCWTVLSKELVDSPVPNSKNNALNIPPQCMPEIYRRSYHSWSSVIEAYRDYYRYEKIAIAKWEKGRPAPDWMK